MKHILNNLTEQEKSAIREQHTGGMKVMTENFSKLTNSKLGDSKPLVSEMDDDFDETSIQNQIDENNNNSTTIAQSNSFLAPINVSETYVVDHPKRQSITINIKNHIVRVILIIWNNFV